MQGHRKSRKTLCFGVQPYLLQAGEKLRIFLHEKNGEEASESHLEAYYGCPEHNC